MALMRMNAAETRASMAMAACTPLAVVSRSSMTAEMDTFMSDVSTTRTNMAIASSTIRRRLPSGAAACSGSVTPSPPGAVTSPLRPGSSPKCRCRWTTPATPARPLPGPPSGADGGRAAPDQPAGAAPRWRRVIIPAASQASSAIPSDSRTGRKATPSSRAVASSVPGHVVMRVIASSVSDGS